MGKYGNGVSMKDAIRMEVEEVNERLNLNGVAEEDKIAILDALKEMAYQWCHSNAFACAMEQIISADMSESEFVQFGQKVMNSPVVMDKMQETFPF